MTDDRLKDCPELLGGLRLDRVGMIVEVFGVFWHTG
jgi:hypothetical protein